MKHIYSRRHVVVWLAVALLLFANSTSRRGGRYLIFNSLHSLRSESSAAHHEPNGYLNASLSDDHNDIMNIPQNSWNNKTTENTIQSPLAKPNRRKQCNPGPYQPLERVHLFLNYANSSSYWSRPKTVEKHADIPCEFNKDRPSAMHFPHAMQQLYACYSLWQEYPTNRPVLLVQNQVVKKLKRNAFLRGIFRLFQSQLAVDVVSKKSYMERKMNRKGGPGPQIIDISGGYVLNQATKLNHLVTNEFHLPSESLRSCSNSKPRIGILNRRVSAGRSIINAELLATAVQELSRNASLSVQHFEGLEFEDQVSFYRSVDILISPHGAQLVGVAFMNAPCAHLVELFPKGYAIPDFFGSLAINSGKKYSYIYMSEGSFRNEQALSFADRRQARSINLCPSTEMIASRLRELALDWSQCCETMLERSG